MHTYVQNEFSAVMFRSPTISLSPLSTTLKVYIASSGGNLVLMRIVSLPKTRVAGSDLRVVPGLDPLRMTK